MPPSSCRSVQSTRIAYPGFPRPRCELGLASRVPQVSAKRAGDRYVPSRRGLLDHPSQCSQPWPVNAVSIVTIQRASDHHASALGTSPGHHRLPSLPAVHCTDHVFSSDARQCPWNLHCKTSRNDHPANSQNVLAFGQPRVSGNVTLHALPQHWYFWHEQIVLTSHTLLHSDHRLNS